MEENQTLSGCLPRLRSIFNILTKAEQKVGEYILANPSEIVHLSITELAEAAGSAEATIFRLCQKLDYKGYQSFKIALASELYSPLESVNQEIDPDDSIKTIASKVFHNITEGLQDTLKIIDEEALIRAIDVLSQASRIDAYGSGGSAIITADIEHRFMRFGVPVRAYSDSHLQISSAAIMKPKDVVIAVSHTGANRDLIDSVTKAKESGATVIAITSHMKSPLSKIADISLYGTARETEYRSESMACRLVHLAIVDILYLGVMFKNQNLLVENMQKIRQAIASRRI